MYIEVHSEICHLILKKKTREQGEKMSDKYPIGKCHRFLGYVWFELASQDRVMVLNSFPLFREKLLQTYAFR